MSVDMAPPPVRRPESPAVGAWGGSGEKAVGRGKCALVKICVRARRIARIVSVNWSHQIRHIGGGTTSKRGITYALMHQDRKSRRKSGNALQLPTFS